MVVLITGANRGLGLEFARQYLQEGHTVFAGCRSDSADDQLRALSSNGGGGELRIVSLDVVDPEQVEQVRELIRTQSGQLDLLINNAGIFPENDFASVTEEQLVESFRVNAVAPLLLVRTLLPLLKRVERPLVVTISSLIGSVEMGAGLGDWKEYAYGLSKAAANRMTRQLAVDLEEHGIVCVAQYPGWVRTDMGGSQAPLSPEESIRSMRGIFARLSITDSGRVIDLDGTDAPV